MSDRVSAGHGTIKAERRRIIIGKQTESYTRFQSSRGQSERPRRERETPIFFRGYMNVRRQRAEFCRARKHERGGTAHSWVIEYIYKRTGDVVRSRWYGLRVGRIIRVTQRRAPLRPHNSVDQQR